MLTTTFAVPSGSSPHSPAPYKEHNVAAFPLLLIAERVSHCGRPMSGFACKINDTGPNVCKTLAFAPDRVSSDRTGSALCWFCNSQLETNWWWGSSCRGIWSNGCSKDRSWMRKVKTIKLSSLIPLLIALICKSWFVVFHRTLPHGLSTTKFSRWHVCCYLGVGPPLTPTTLTTIFVDDIYWYGELSSGFWNILKNLVNEICPSGLLTYLIRS